MKTMADVSMMLYANTGVDAEGNPVPGLPPMIKRQKALKDLSAYTGRNTIAYYTVNKGMICDEHVHEIVEVVDGMDPAKGLDLIIHTGGGLLTAAEAIMKYLRKAFGSNIRVIVPAYAFSSGTLMAMCAKEILLGRGACLGPIDAQVLAGKDHKSVFSLYREMRAAKEEMAANPASVPYWQARLTKYPAGIFNEVMDCIRHSAEVATTGLTEVMFSDGSVDANGIKKIVAAFNATNLSHGRHIDFDQCKEIGLRVRELDEDVKLHDFLMMLHDMYILTMGNDNVISMIEGSNGKFNWHQ